MTDLGPCAACGTPYDECPVYDGGLGWDTDANGNHVGLCCEDCQHLAQRRLADTSQEAPGGPADEARATVAYTCRCGLWDKPCPTVISTNETLCAVCRRGCSRLYLDGVRHEHVDFELEADRHAGRGGHERWRAARGACR